MSRLLLVTGAGGFIGRHLVRDQLARGHRVRALDIDDANLRDLQADPERKLEVVIGDVTSAECRRSALAGVDIVIHLASAHLEKGLPDDAYERVNVSAVGSLVEDARRAGVQRFIQVSSCGVHGCLDENPGDEESPVDPGVAYERTKLAGERVALDAGRACGMGVVVIRPVWVYGPGCPRTTRLFSLIARGRFVMIGAGRNVRASIYISDFLDALERSATVPGVEGEVFIATHPEQVTVLQIVTEISHLAGVRRAPVRIPVWLGRFLAATAEFAAALIGREPPISRRSLKFFTNDAGFTGDKARKRLGFEARFDLAQGLEKTWHALQHPQRDEPGLSVSGATRHG